MDLLISAHAIFGAVPLAVAAVVIAKLWQRRRDAPVAELEAQNQEMRQELATLRRELTEAQERADTAERLTGEVHMDLERAATR